MEFTKGYHILRTPGFLSSTCKPLFTMTENDNNNGANNAVNSNGLDPSETPGMKFILPSPRLPFYSQEIETGDKI